MPRCVPVAAIFEMSAPARACTPKLGLLESVGRLERGSGENRNAAASIFLHALRVRPGPLGYSCHNPTSWHNRDMTASHCRIKGNYLEFT